MRRENIRTNEEEVSASIGIGAMIVFIALILVAAVASAVIIQTGEKLQQNAQQTGDDTREEIGGKITIITVWVADQSDCDGDDDGATGGVGLGIDMDDKCVTLVFELAAGSEPVDETNVIWTIICNDGAGNMVSIWGDFAIDAADPNEDTVGTDTVNVDNTAKADTTLSPGEVYMIDLKVETDDDDVPSEAECAPEIGEEHTLIISVEGGGTTYETMSYNSVKEGDTIV